MECAENNSFIITLSIIAHGAVTKIELNDELIRVFEDVRSFLITGDYVPAYIRNGRDILNYIYKLFQQNLTNPTIESINQYISYSRPRYLNMVKGYSLISKDTDYPLSNHENACRLVPRIVYDKIISTTPPSSMSIVKPMETINCIYNYFIPDFEGVFLISVHRKISNDNLELIFPTDENKNKQYDLLNIDTLLEISDFFKPITIDELSNYSTEQPMMSEVNRDIELIKTREISKKPKKKLIKKRLNRYKRDIDSFNMTLIGNKITKIKFSFLIYLLKQIFGINSKINSLDYSCNNISDFFTLEQKERASRILNDIITRQTLKQEQWGGRKNKKNKKNNKTKKYNKKKHNYNKTNKSRKNLKK
jgi:hypothetical protein